MALLRNIITKRKIGNFNETWFLWVEAAIPREVARVDTSAALLVIEVTEDTAEAEAAAVTRIDAVSVLTVVGIIMTEIEVHLAEADPILAVVEMKKEMK